LAPGLGCAGLYDAQYQQQQQQHHFPKTSQHHHHHQLEHHRPQEGEQQEEERYEANASDSNDESRIANLLVLTASLSFSQLAFVYLFFVTKTENISVNSSD
jgi:hypothetical protein